MKKYPRVEIIMRRLGHRKVEKLAKYTERELKRVTPAGVYSIREIKKALAEKGLKLKKEK